jgi:carbamoyltransferase
MKILSISVGHDSSLSFYDGKEVRYCKMERLVRRKHSEGRIFEILDRLPEIFGITLADVDVLGFDSWISRYIVANEEDINFGVANKLYKNLREEPTNVTEYLQDFIGHPNIWIVPHHLAHINSAWMMEGTPDKYICIDGVGDWKIWSVYDNEQNLLDCLYYTSDQVGSIGLDIIDAAEKVGIQATSILDLAGKFMGLQSYGKVDQNLLENLKKYNIKDCKGMFNTRLTNKIDWAATIHARCGEMIYELFDEYVNVGETVLYSGGVALNVIWNTELRKKYNLIIPPHCSDEGISLGILEILRKQYDLPKVSINNFPFSQQDEKPENVSEETIQNVAQALAEGKVVAWYQGNGEIGPRALGNRSILMDPRIKDGRDIINKIKNREKFRPFGASVLQDKMHEAFDEISEDKYMLFTSKPKIDVPAITHVDGTCRVQTVGDENATFKKLLEEFYKITKCPVLLNTSLNLSGDPIAAYKWEAKELTKTVDLVVIGDMVYNKINKLLVAQQDSASDF